MIEWNTYNKGVVVRDVDSTEIKIQRYLERYQEGLRLHQKGQTNEAKSVYEDILSDRLVKRAPTNAKEAQMFTTESSPLALLCFLVTKNYASLLQDEYMASDGQDPELAKSAIRHYLRALSIDKTDNSLWYNVGNLAQKSGNMPLARIAFEQGVFEGAEKEDSRQQLDNLFKLSGLSPIKWRCIEKLLEILVAIGDCGQCRMYLEIIGKYMPEWQFGKELEQRMGQHPEFEERMEVDEVTPKVNVNIEKLDWYSLAKTLVERYSAALSQDEENIINRNIRIDVSDSAMDYVLSQQRQATNAESDVILINDDAEPPPPVNNIDVNEDVTMKDAQDEKNDTSTQSQPVGDETNVAMNDVEQSPQRDETGAVPLKRQRSDEHSGNEEDESEDKRATLRSSKRQKEIEKEENTRRKMHSEELQFSAMVQDLFDKLGPIFLLKRSKPWYTPVSLGSDPSKTQTFWEWFDYKISELRIDYSWDFDAARFTRSGNTNIENKVERMGPFTYTPFQGDKSDTGPSAVLEFIQELNFADSGMVNTMHQLALRLLRQDIVYGIPEETADIMLQIVILLEQSFMDTISCIQDQEPLELALKICERLADKIISLTTSFLELSCAVGPTAKRKVAAEKSEVDGMLEEYWPLWSTWSSFYERLTIQYPPSDELQLRFLFANGKIAQCSADIEKAFDIYKRCKEVASQVRDPIQTHCIYDGTISQQVIQEKIKALEVGTKLAAAKVKFENEDYDSVINDLSHFVEDLTNAERAGTDLYETFLLLFESYKKTNDITNAWNCQLRALDWLVTKLIEYACRQMQTTILKKDQDTEFFKFLKRIDTCLRQLHHMRVIDGNPWPSTIDTRTVDNILLILQMTIIYTYRHPDFIHIVNNFSGSEMHRPSLTTRNSKFNSIISTSWAVAASLVESAAYGREPAVKQVINDGIANVLAFIHDELGEREICGGCKSAFVKYLLDFLTSHFQPEFRGGLYQCYHCVYGVHLTVGHPGSIEEQSYLVEEHRAPHEKLSQEAAEKLFNLVVGPVMGRLKQGTQLRNDTKEVVELLLQHFDRLPKDNSWIKLNKNLLDAYLAREAPMKSSVNAILRDAFLPSIPIDMLRSKISPVQTKLFYIQGKLLRTQAKGRAKVNSERTIENLEDAIGYFQKHIIVNPDDACAWAELGRCYVELSEEELTWSASNITGHKKKIADYQRRAYNAFWRAWHLFTTTITEGFDDAAKFDFFFHFGYLVYSMISAPMSGYAFRPPKQIKSPFGQQKSNVKKIEPNFAYKLVLTLLQTAMTYKSGDKSEWRCLYFSGKCFRKLKRPAREVLDMYRKAAISASSVPSQDPILDPFYALYSTIAKFLYEDKMKPIDALPYLTENLFDRTKTTQNPPTEVDSNVQAPPPSSSSVYEMVVTKLKQLQSLDKRKWHHRHTFRLAWMYHRVLGRPEQAKETILQLFTLRGNLKNHLNMWKPTYERAGKYFEYVHEYTLFLIQVARDTKDQETLKILCDKLPRAGIVLLHPNETYTSARDAYEQVKAEAASKPKPMPPATPAPPPPPPPPPPHPPASFGNNNNENSSAPGTSINNAIVL